MENILFTIYDKASERFSPIATAPTLAVAKRQLANSFKQQGIDDEALADFQFFAVGSWSEKTGDVVITEKQEFFLK